MFLQQTKEWARLEMGALIDKINFMGQTYETPKKQYPYNKRSWVYYIGMSIWNARRVTPTDILVISTLTVKSIRWALKLTGIFGIIEFVLPNLKSAVGVLEGLQDPFQIGRQTNSKKKSIIYKKYCGEFTSRTNQLVECLLLECQRYADSVLTSSNPLVNRMAGCLVLFADTVYRAATASLRYTTLSIRESLLRANRFAPKTSGPVS